MNRGETRVTVRYTMLGVNDGKLLWEATSDGIATTGTTVEKAPAIIEAVNLAVEKIVGSLPFGSEQPAQPSGGGCLGG